MNTNLRHRVGRFGREEDGSATLMALYFSMIILVVGGMAIDFQKRQADARHLQLAADVAAHAALYTREFEDATIARATALDTLQNLLPRTNMDTAIGTADITFGTWDFDTDTFTADPTSREAVRVYAGMTEARGNPTPNLLLRMIGFDTFNVAADSVYVTYRPPCFREGFVADDVVNVQSNNFYGTGFCIHSNTYVSINNNNIFEEGSVVSMPNLEDLDIPNNGMQTNDGLDAALREGRYRLRILRQLPEMIDGLAMGHSHWTPDYITSNSIESISKKSLQPTDFVQGRVHVHSCNGGKIDIGAGLYHQVVLVTDCEIRMSNGAVLDEAIFATRLQTARSINGPQGFQLGRSDDCAPGGGASLITLGGVSVAANLEAYNGQILAWQDIDFAARADGIQGASFMTYGRIDSTSNMSMGFCDGKIQPELLSADYYRMVD